MADLDAIVAGIEAGDYDDDLAVLVAACRRRDEVTDRKMRWRITLDGEVWDEDTVTIGELQLVASMSGTEWPPEPLESAKVAMLYVIAHWTAGGMELKDAWDKAAPLNAKALIAAVSEYQGEPPGKDRAASTI